jgi:hypothetical protein
MKIIIAGFRIARPGRSPRVRKGGIECKTENAKCKMKEVFPFSVIRFPFSVISAVAHARAFAS